MKLSGYQINMLLFLENNPGACFNDMFGKVHLYFNTPSSLVNKKLVAKTDTKPYNTYTLTEAGESSVRILKRMGLTISHRQQDRRI